MTEADGPAPERTETGEGVVLDEPGEPRAAAG